MQFFFVDTTPSVKEYWNEPDKHNDWREVAPCEKYISNLLKDLDMALKESTTTWKFVVGHHTITSVSIHGDTIKLVEELLPILKVNMFLAHNTFYGDVILSNSPKYIHVDGIDEMRFKVVFYDIYGRNLHRWSMTKEVNLAM